MRSACLSATWLGHGTFLLETPGGRRFLVDPWLDTNPACPEEWKGGGWRQRMGRLDAVLVTHGHSDHMADALPVAQASGAPIVSIFEIASYLQAQGAPAASGMNKGGTQEVAGVRISLVHADHSSCGAEHDRLVPLGEACGFVLRFDGAPAVYFAGDTALFGDMALIRRLYEPALAFLPIGDRFTMGPEAAAVACELLGVPQIVPMHYGTFPVLTGTPAALRELVTPLGVAVTEFRPGETKELALGADH